MRRSVPVVLAAVLGLVLLLPARAEAQIRRPAWGFTASFTPNWEVPGYQRRIFDAESVDLKGAEFRIGVAKGETRGGDWGVSFVSRFVEDGGRVVRTDATDQLETVAVADVRLYGIEVHAFEPFTTIADRAQIGLLVGAGLGVWRGDVQRSTNGAPQQPVDPHLLLSIRGKSVPVVPTGRVELAATAILMPRLKIRVSGGVGFPGQHAFSIGFVALMGRR